MARIAFVNVTKRFGETVAVDDISFEVADNEFFCIFGPPTSGKSTILRLLLGLETPDSGDILIDGRSVLGEGPARRNIAMVFQNLALFPHMSAGDNVRFPLVERKVSAAAIAARVEAVAAKLHIAHILHKMPAQLSGGERQRVAIARALVREPVAYLMDDPISALDARLREETRVELKRIQRELGQTLIYVTHDQEEAMSVADRMAILEQGKVRQIDRPEAIYDRPASRYVARLVGSPPINLLPGRVREGRFESEDGRLTLPLGRGPIDHAAPVDLGVRPEDVEILAPETDGAATAAVYEVEPLGGFTVVDVEFSGQVLRAMVRGQPRLKPKEPVGLTIRPERVHLFARDTGAALFREARG
ncbi:carbohydrate ABC transporter ATP-binding protein (CUT1 family) [Tepidamorphus gemmatus]|jgi:multiple sugar transport system ATP-binding protein|uniref:Carbohydrate ABC transporter ATP-binding protein (CUT1 family) n=1 Tax=Tepidamorphus gemmatus TaxID=747076 RepID=A0A4R3M8Z5_9HYPH|nr:ABC transporter ATP-binding protein [Tepidamorphus gemmatus]TCT08759.1 carbohydrate ABC transporter ATP-binding protein (CUT1 family) [Tepidamorphus gemmatus]